MRVATRTLAACALGAMVSGVLAWGALSSADSATAAEGFETYVACGLTRNATPSHVCHLAEGKEFGAFFRSPTEVTYTVCVEFPTAKELCAETPHATAETLYVNPIKSNLPGVHRVTWSVEGQPVGLWEFRIPVDPPVFGKTATVVPVSGAVLVKGPGEHDFSPLTSTGSIRSGTMVDTSRGKIELMSASGPSGGTESGLFRGGVFRFTQKLAPSRLKGGRSVGFTVLTLTGGRSLECRRSGARRDITTAVDRRNHGGGRLWGNAHGNFQTGGRYATVTVRGTNWLTEDTCAGTRVKVTRGVVSVNDLPHHRTILVRAPHSFLAHPGSGG